jgi:predicted metal-dependent peptidase
MTSVNSATLEERLLDCFPSGSYALAALLRLVDIVPTEAIPTAAVECRVQPRLLINPDFVERHARTSEKLLMLVMHELHHVLLGHTTLFPTHTPVQNFVFDCIINALISRMFPQPEHLGFLNDYYSDASFPECLLRPVAGWPHVADAVPLGIAALPERARAEAAAIHRALYSEAGATYAEVYEILPRLLSNAALGEIPLLGDHGENSATAGDLERRAPVLFDIVREIVEEWPLPPDPIRGRSFADIVTDKRRSVRRARSNRKILRQLIRKVAGSEHHGSVRQFTRAPDAPTTPMPRLDRRSTVMRALGIEPLWYSTTDNTRRRLPVEQRVHVYLDVSGSMNGVCDALYGAVLDCHGQVHPTVHLFSTRVSDVTLAQLRDGVCRSTGGTAIDCVAEHIATHRIRRAVVITDGWVGTPQGRHLRTLAKTRLAVAYAGNNIQTADLSAVANHTTRIEL